MNGLRIVLASRIYAPEPSAASLRLSALTDELAQRGSEVRVLTTHPPAGSVVDVEERTARAPHVSRWPVLRDRAGYVRGYLQYLSFDLPLFFRILFGKRADIYICEPPPTSGLSMAIALMIRRRPFVYYAADIWSDAAAATTAPAFVVALVRWMERFVLSRAALVLVVSDGVDKRVKQLVPGPTTSVVGHGVDLTLFSSSGVYAAESADIVYVGSASEWHGAEVAVNALVKLFEEAPDLTAAFVGQGSSWGRLVAIVREHGLERRIRFYPTVPPEQAAAWLRGAKLSLATLVPGKGYDFAVPTKLYASIAVGTPVAYAGPDPVRSMVEANRLGVGTGYDADEYAAGIRKVLADDKSVSWDHLTSWSERNISACSVAERAADAILGVLRPAR